MNELTGEPSQGLLRSLKNYAPAERKADAIVEIEDLVKSGKSLRAAVEEVAYRTGLGERSLFTYLARTKGVPREEWEDALTRKKPAPRPRESCHSEALKRFIDLCRTGRNVTDCYRQLMAEAEENGWTPIPSERTMRRKLDAEVSWSDRWAARRAASRNARVR
ncbi:MAG: hypothetical protein HC783_04965 [Rhodobacteraceae bacterium]|nr:hypothetical protein [Paracoccaceae bacterium]